MPEADYIKAIESLSSDLIELLLNLQPKTPLEREQNVEMVLNHVRRVINAVTEPEQAEK